MRTIRLKLFHFKLGLALTVAMGAAPISAHSDIAQPHAVRYDVTPSDPGQPRIAPPGLIASQPLIVAAGGDWDELSAEEQRALARHRQDWRQYSPPQRARLREGVQRYMNLSPQERNEAQRGHERYERMSPKERERERERYKRERERD